MKRLRSLINVKGEAYHDEIDRIAGDLHPCDAAFPWDQLREYASSVVRKQKGILIPDGLDFFLSETIRDHQRKDVAVATCAHFLSGSCTVRLLENELGAQIGDVDALETFSQCVIAINHYNPVAVPSQEADRARMVIQLLPGAKDRSPKVFQALLNLFAHGIPTSSLFAPHLVKMLASAANEVHQILSVLRCNAQWAHASALSSWFCKLPQMLSPVKFGCLDTGKILDSSPLEWRAWASWRPNRHALKLVAQHIASEDRICFSDLLALEGPSFADCKYSSYGARLLAMLKTNSFNIGQMEFMFANHEPHYIAQQLQTITSSLVQAATSSSARNQRLVLFKSICVGREINESSLAILRIIGSEESEEVIIAIQGLLKAFDHNQDPSYKDLLILQRAASHDSGTALERLFGPTVRKSLSNAFAARQHDLRTTAFAGGVWSEKDHLLMMELYTIGMELSARMWQFTALSLEQQALLKQWPSRRQVEVLYDVGCRNQEHPYHSTSPLSAPLAQYAIERLAKPGNINKDARTLVDAILDLWQVSMVAADTDRQTLALITAVSWPHLDITSRSKCIRTLAGFADEEISALLHILESAHNIGYKCTTLAQHLVISPNHTEVWREVLLVMIKQSDESLLEWGLQYLDSKTWFSFMGKLADIFTDKISWSIKVECAILAPVLHEWTSVVSRYAAVLERMEDEAAMKHAPAMQCLLRGGSTDLQDKLHQILKFLDTNHSESKWTILQKLTARLSPDGANAEAVRWALTHVQSATPEGEEALLHVLEVYEEISQEVAEIMLLAWHKDADLMPMDMVALEALASVLGIEISENVPFDHLEATEEWIQGQYDELLVEAHRLESLRIAFKSLQPEETAKMLEELGIEDTSPVDDLLQKLPPDMISFIEKVSENEVELSIPITNLTALQRKAMGSGTAQNLLVRFSPGYSGMTSTFCMHFDSEETKDYVARMHSPCLLVGDEPDEHTCFGKLTPAVYQLSRLLFEEIKANGVTSLSSLYKFLSEEIVTLGSKCVVCGVLHGYRVKRATVCFDKKCATIFARSHLEVRLGDIRADPAVVDLLLTAIYATASQSSQAATLLSGCPISEPQRVKYIIDNFPAIARWQNSTDLATVFKALDMFRDISKEAADLLSWACNSYKGFLCSVTPNLRIPSLPNTHQFILANASPSQEAAFSSKIVGGATRVMFHGTNMERLNAILREGLRDLSGTALQRNGQSYGRGVYLSSDPATAWGYTSPTTSWKGSSFSHHRVLLGIELAGNWNPVSGNIHVVSDPSSVMIRYIFLCPNNASIPIANHVVPAMQSVFNGLRSGAF